MIVQRFVKWCETATSRQRAEGAAILARAFAEDRIDASDLAASEAAMTLLLDDPSPKVRLALAEELAFCRHAPRYVVLALSEDADEIACRVLASTPALSEGDLIDLVASGRASIAATIAARSLVTMRVAAAIAEVGGTKACAALLANPCAAVASISYRRIAERFGSDDDIRAALLDRDDLPVGVRQTLILELGRALSQMGFVRHALGQRRTETCVFDACERATAMLADGIRTGEMPALVEHLRISNQLSPAFLLRIVCSGNIDLFAAALVALSGLSERRVRAIVVDGREPAFSTLLKSCGLPADVAPVLRMAIQLWRKEAAMPHKSKADFPAEVMIRLAAAFRERSPGAMSGEAGARVAVLVTRLETEALRGSARQRALRLAAA